MVYSLGGVFVMYNIRTMNKADIGLISNFIAQYNSNPKNHIGYCGLNKDEIASCLGNDQNLLLSFTLVYHDDVLVGLLGYDYYDNTAELWGPFVNLSYDFEKVANFYGKV